MKPPIKTLCLLTSLALLACDSGTTTSTNGDTPAAHPLASVLISDAPANPISVVEARKNPTVGTEVIVSGDIMGKPEVFVPNRAMLTLGDPNVLTTCNRRPGDLCEAPWDVCCDDGEVIKKSIVTIQLLDADGNLIKTGLKGLGDMKELSSLVVKGTVADGSNADNLIINAGAIHIASVKANNTPRK